MISRLFLYLLGGLTLFTLVLTTACQTKIVKSSQPVAGITPSTPTAIAISSPRIKKLIRSGIEQTQYTRYYDPAYVPLEYPGGDVPLETGVCTDVVIRAFRKVGVDLQKEVREDMERNFAAYPQLWGLKKPDSNIDHRRVPNLMKYFQRRGKSIQIDNKPENYLPGDIVAWNLGNGQQHIGLVSNNISPNSKNLLIIHNIGSGAKQEDILFNWPIIGHYRYFN
jgi:uncharacterized protein